MGGSSRKASPHGPNSGTPHRKISLKCTAVSMASVSGSLKALQEFVFMRVRIHLSRSGQALTQAIYHQPGGNGRLLLVWHIAPGPWTLSWKPPLLMITAAALRITLPFLVMDMLKSSFPPLLALSHRYSRVVNLLHKPPGSV